MTFTIPDPHKTPCEQIYTMLEIAYLYDIICSGIIKHNNCAVRAIVFNYTYFSFQTYFIYPKKETGVEGYRQGTVTQTWHFLFNVSKYRKKSFIIAIHYSKPQIIEITVDKLMSFSLFFWEYYSSRGRCYIIVFRETL